MIFLAWYLWVVPHILLGICLVGLLRRPRPRQLFLFLCYLVVQIVGFSCLVPLIMLRRYPSAVSWYERINNADTLVSELVALGVIYQLADEFVLSRLSLRDAARTLMRWTLAALLLVTTATSALFQNAGLQNTWKVFQAVDFSGNVMTLGLLLTILLFTRALHISWRTLPAGVVLGFGVHSSVELSAATLISVFRHGQSLVFLDLIRMAAFHVCALIWLVYIFLPEGEPRVRGKGLSKSSLETWDQELKQLVQR
jgi:hypothetical protein